MQPPFHSGWMSSVRVPSAKSTASQLMDDSWERAIWWMENVDGSIMWDGIISNGYPAHHPERSVVGTPHCSVHKRTKATSSQHNNPHGNHWDPYPPLPLHILFTETMMLRATLVKRPRCFKYAERRALREMTFLSADSIQCVSDKSSQLLNRRFVQNRTLNTKKTS